nr:MAG TPA: hypothetical protein [Bacteriophage sp.]
MDIRSSISQKYNNEIFFSYGFCRRAKSIGFYNKIIKKKGFNSKF